MQINLTDLNCTRVGPDSFECVANQPSIPMWFYPLVIACFIVAVIVLILVAKMTLAPRHMFDRRVENKPVAHERRGP